MVNPNSPIGLGITRQVNGVSQELRRTTEQLASGRRITTFAVDAAGGSIASQFESVIRGLQQEIRNDQDQISRLQVQDGGLESVSGDLQRIRELSVQLGNATTDETAEDAIRDEIAQRIDNIRETVETTQFSGNSLIQVDEKLNAVLSGVVDIETVDDAIAEVAAQRADVGAETNRVESRIASRQVAEENAIAAQSRIGDLDYAQGVTDLVNQQIRSQAGLGVLKTFQNIDRQNAASLLGALG